MRCMSPRYYFSQFALRDTAGASSTRTRRVRAQQQPREWNGNGNGIGPTGTALSVQTETHTQPTVPQISMSHRISLSRGSGSRLWLEPAAAWRQELATRRTAEARHGRVRAGRAEVEPTRDWQGRWSGGGGAWNGKSTCTKLYTTNHVRRWSLAVR